jgi:hypothetical protein
MHIPPHFTTISLAAASVIFVLALLLKWKPLRKIEFLIPWFLLTAGIGFAAAFLVSWVHWTAGFATAIPVFGSVLMKVLAIVLLFIVLYDFWPRHPANKTTEVAAVLLPSFAGEIGGLVGSLLARALTVIAIVAASGLAKLFGM